MLNAEELSTVSRTRVRVPRYLVWGVTFIALAVAGVFAADWLGWTGYWSSEPPPTAIGFAMAIVTVISAILGVLVLLVGGLTALLLLILRRRPSGETST